MNRLLVFCFVLFCAGPTALAQKTYTYLIFHKLNPGLTIQDALPVEREWKAINQAAVDEGKLIGWHMMVKQFSSNPNTTEYDYVTCIVSPTMGMKGASPTAMAKLYGDSIQTRMADLQKRDRQTAPVVKIEIWENLDALFGPDVDPSKTPIAVVDCIKLRYFPGLVDPVTDWLPMAAVLKKAATTQIDQKQLGGWSFSALLVPNGSEKGYGFAQVRLMNSLSVLSEMADPKLSKQLARTGEIVRQEVFRFEQFTTRPVLKK